MATDPPIPPPPVPLPDPAEPEGIEADPLKDALMDDPPGPLEVDVLPVLDDSDEIKPE